MSTLAIPGTGVVMSMTSDEYQVAPGLSNSSMDDLAVSPLRFWYRHINPILPEEPTREMQIGSAVHCAVLEPGQFDSRYCCELIPPEGCLVTMEDLRGWIRDKGYQPRGTRKADAVAQAKSIDPAQPILDVLTARHAEQHAGKVMFKLEDWERITGCAKALSLQPEFVKLLGAGQPEVSIFATDPDTVVPLKARLDWLAPEYTVDLKTFSQKRGKSIDKSVTDAIWYEGYNRQAVFYTMLRRLQPGCEKLWPDFVMVFVESEEPHEVRIRSMRPTTGGSPNLFWDRARIEIRELIRLYAEFWQRFGTNPWRTAQVIDPLMDEDLPGLAYS